jgi:hypothetical protein
MNFTDASVMIVDEAREILQTDLGIQVTWDENATSSPIGIFLFSLK